MALTHEEFYKASNLSSNPFRTTPVSEADPRKGIWIGYDKERERLMKILVRSRADQVGNINFALIYGELGIGKSHSLLWAQYQLQKVLKDEFNCFAFYIPTLKKSRGLLSFAEAFTDDIISKTNILNDILEYKQFIEVLIVEFRKDNKISGKVTRESILEEILPIIELSNLAKEILKCDSESDVNALLSPKGDHAAFLLFTRLTNLFVYEHQIPSGYHRFKKAVYLFIDELDLLARSTAKEAREVNDLLRHIFDACPSCFCMILAFTATAAEINILFAEYLLSRVTHQIVLSFLQPDEAKLFIRDILNTARINDKKNIDYYPFTEECLETIASQLVSITPRKIVTLMQQILEECRLAGINPSKDLVTSQMMDDHNIWEEVVT